MRQFWLLSENDKDLLIDLQEKDAFGADPEGLGVSIAASGYRAGNDIIYYNDQPTYEQVKFSMVFGSIEEEPYNAFNNFMSKINGQKLLLAYKPDDGPYDPYDHVVPSYYDDTNYPHISGGGQTTYDVEELKSEPAAKSKTVSMTGTIKSKTFTLSGLLTDDYKNFTVEVYYFGTSVTPAKLATYTSGTNASKTATTKKVTKKTKKGKVVSKTTTSIKVTCAYTASSKSIKLTFAAASSKTTIANNTKVTVKVNYTNPIAQETTTDNSSSQYTLTPSGGKVTISDINIEDYAGFKVFVQSGTSVGKVLTAEAGINQNGSGTIDSIEYTATYNGNTTVTISSSNTSSYKVMVIYDYEVLDPLSDDDYAMETDTIYFRKVKFVSATKGEIEHNVGWLKSDLTLAPTTPWFTWEQVPIAGTNVNRVEVDTSDCMLFASDQTVPLKVIYIAKAYMSTFKVLVEYPGEDGTTKESLVTFNKAIPTGAIVDINSDFEDLKARYSTDNGSTWTDLMPYLSTSGVGFARVKANAISYLDFQGTSETFNKQVDRIYYRREMVIV